MTVAFGTAIVRTKKDGTERIIDFEIEDSFEDAARIVDEQNAKNVLPENLRYAVASIQLAEERPTEVQEDPDEAFRERMRKARPGAVVKSENDRWMKRADGLWYYMHGGGTNTVGRGYTEDSFDATWFAFN